MRTGSHPGSDAVRRASSQQGQHTLAAILAAAADLASLEGLEQLSMRRLASAVGMSKSGLYAHFGSKEQIQLATIAHFSEVFEANVLRATPAHRDSGLRGLLERWLDFFEHEVFPGGCFLIISAVEFASRPGPVRDALAAGVELQIAALETAVERALQAGELRAGRDSAQTAFEMHSILINSHALFQVEHDPAVFDRARAAIARLLA